jgi:hypothetical protein
MTVDPTSATDRDPGWQPPSSEVARRLDPAEMLLRLMAQSATRAVWLADLIRVMVEREGIGALISEKTGPQGNPMGEEVRALVRMEAEERKKASELALKAVAAGIAQRQVELAQREAQIMISGMMAFAKAMGFDPSDMAVREKISASLIQARDHTDNVLSGRAIEGGERHDRS